MNPTRIAVIALAVGIAALAAFLALGGDDGAPVHVPTTPDVEAGAVGDEGADSRPQLVEASSRTVLEATESAARRPVHPSVKAALSGFRGRIVTPQLEPLPALPVVVYRFAADSVITAGVIPFGDGPRYTPDVDAGETRTDAEGRFEITGVWPRGFYLLRAGVGTDTPTNHIVQDIPGPGEIVDLGDIVVAPSGILTGRIVDDDGEPIAGALVRAADVPGGFLTMVPIEQFDPTGGLIVAEGSTRLAIECPPWVEARFEELPIPSTRSGADGAFRLTGVTPGINVVAATRTGKLSSVRQTVRVDAGVEKDLGEFRLREGETLYGRVVDGAGEPIAGAEVFAAPVNSIPVHFARFTAPTGADGAFEATGFPNGNVIVAVRRRPGEPWTITESTPITRDIEVVLAAASSLKVTVISEPGLPLADVEFQLCPGELGEAAVEMAMWGATRPLDLSERVSRDEDGPWIIADVPDGKYALLARADGHAVAGVAVEVEGPSEIQVTLKAHTGFDVLVVDALGKPVAGAEVYAMARGRPRIPEMPVHCGTTDEDGAVAVDEVASPTVRVTASHPAYGNAHAEVELPLSAPVRLQMDLPGVIEGILTEKGGKPTPGKWLVTLERKRSGGPRGAMPDMPRAVVPGPDGAFRATGLRPGEYEVSSMDSVSAVTSPGGVMGLMQTAWMRSSRPETRVTLAPGGVASVLLDTSESDQEIGPSAQVTGIALVDGRPAQGMSIVAWSDGRRNAAEIDESGLFDLGRVRVGDVNLELYDTSQAGSFEFRRDSLWSKSIEVKENENQHLSIEIALSQLAGSVVDETGAPAAECRVTLHGSVEGSGDSTWFHEQADQAGEFEFERLPAGTYSIEAESDTGRARLAGVVVGAGVPVTGLRLVMERLQVVRGRIELAAFGDDKGDWVWVQFNRVAEGEGAASESHWTWCDEASGAFESNELSPGRWTAEFHLQGNDSEWHWVHEGEILIGSTDVQGLVLRPVKKKRSG